MSNFDAVLLDFDAPTTSCPSSVAFNGFDAFSPSGVADPFGGNPFADLSFGNNNLEVNDSSMFICCGSIKLSRSPSQIGGSSA